MTKFKHIHSSSRYDRSPEVMERCAKKYNANADLVTYTEVQLEPREQAIKRANGKQFGFVRGDATYSNDCAISYNKSVFRVLYSENFKSTNKTYYNVDGMERTPPYMTIAVLEHSAT